jgi:DNA (cytosine-5)-methyltransferase 1
LRDVYFNNFGICPEGDIRRIRTREIPSHDILCAGFPCQPFSKAGDQKGTLCPRWGDLFTYVLRVLRKHKPRYILLENVPNLKYHNSGKTWEEMERKLKKCGYEVNASLLSPHSFGIPQIRERLFIVGSRKGLGNFEWPSRTTNELAISSILDNEPKDARVLSAYKIRCLETWQAFLDAFPSDLDLPSFPIWSMEFGATYPFENITPFAVGKRKLTRYRGAHGYPLREAKPDERLDHLPSYARTRVKHFPGWKIRFIRQNRDFYHQHKERRGIYGNLSFSSGHQE